MMALLKKRRVKKNLKDGEVICSRCNGMGYEKRNAGWGKQERLSCALCDAEGKVDWIRNIIGPDYAMPQQYWLDRSYARIIFDWLYSRMRHV